MHENQQHIPQYVVIKNYLRKMASEKNPNEKMPSETQIAASFGVSRGTAKQAITDLVYEGTLYAFRARARLSASGAFPALFPNCLPSPRTSAGWAPIRKPAFSS